MNKIVGKILNILIAIVIIIILFILYNTLQTSILKRDYTNLFGFTMLQISTGSMKPTLEVKDIIIVKLLTKETREELKENDVVVFKSDVLVVHRIISIDGEDVITKGDANNAEDKPVQKDMIIGKMVKVISKIGIWEKVFTTPRVYVSILITISLFGITFLYNKNEE